jgi:hypothetical protein
MKTKKSRGVSKRTTRHQRSKKQEYIHPALYQKQGAYGMSTFSRETKESNDYSFALIAQLLKTNNTKFTNLVPAKLDDTTVIDYETIKDRHLKYLPSLSKEEATLNFMKYKRNAFSFNMNPGILFYATKLNHSCNPHVKYYPSENNMMVFETIRQISAGDEVFDSYISSHLPPEERKSTLLSRYGFECKCEKCVANN